MNIGRYIYGKLSNTTAITDLVGTRIYPVFLPMGAEYPAIVYTASNNPLDRGMKTEPADHDKAAVSFFIWADHAQGQEAYDLIDDIDSALRTALDFVVGTESGVTVEDCKYLGSQDGRDEDRLLFMRKADYTFTTKN